MAERPEKRKGEMTPREAAQNEKSAGEQRSRRDAPTPQPASSEGEARDLSDPREEEGWTQPESSAQKGVEPDEG